MASKQLTLFDKECQFTPVDGGKVTVKERILRERARKRTVYKIEVPEDGVTHGPYEIYVAPERKKK